MHIFTELLILINVLVGSTAMMHYGHYRNVKHTTTGMKACVCVNVCVCVEWDM